MKTATVSNLPFPRFIGIRHAKDHVLLVDTMFERYNVPAGTTVKLWQSENFGHALFAEGTKDTAGNVLGQRWFRY